jgi:hypothetical protein
MHAGTGVLAVVASASQGARAGAGVVPGSVRTFRFVKRCVPNPQHLLKAHTVGRSLLRISGTLRLVGQLLYVIVTFLHTGGEANAPPFSQCMPAVAL